MVLFVETTFNVTVADTLIWVPDDNPPGHFGFCWHTGTRRHLDILGNGKRSGSGGGGNDRHVRRRTGRLSVSRPSYKPMALSRLLKNFPGFTTERLTALTVDDLGMVSNEATDYITV